MTNEDKTTTIIKYVAAIFILTAMFAHAYDLYPYNLIIHITGACLWTYVGLKWNEHSILLNFAPQILILGSGIIWNYL